MRIAILGSNVVADRLRELVAATRPYVLVDRGGSFSIHVRAASGARVQVDSPDGPFEQVFFRELRAAARRHPNTAGGIGYLELDAEGGNQDPRVLVVGVPTAFDERRLELLVRALWIALLEATRHGQPYASWWDRWRRQPRGLAIALVYSVLLYAWPAAAQTSEVVVVNDQPAEAVAVRCVNTAGSAFEACGGAGGGGGDGAILDGVSAAIKATVFDFTNSNPLAINLRDAIGDAFGTAANPLFANSNTRDGAGNSIASAIAATAGTERGLVTRPTISQRAGTSVTFDDGADTAEVDVSGYVGAGFQVDAGTLDAVLGAQYTLNGSTWFDTLIVSRTTTPTAQLTPTTGVAFANPNPATSIIPLLPTGTLRARLVVQSFTAGAANVRGFANSNTSGATTEFLSQYATTCTPDPCFTVKVRTANGAEPTVSSAGGWNVTLLGQNDRHVAISVSESVAAPTANTWYLKRQWLVPFPSVFFPARAQASVTTAGSRTLIALAHSFGSFNLSTNVFTDGSGVIAPHHRARMFACVTTALSAAATDVTVTYTDELGNTGNTTTALTIPASAPVGNCFEFQLAATTGQKRDSGVRDVTAVSDTAAPTGVIEIFGFNPLLDTQGVANALETTTSDIGETADNSNEQVMILFMQAATTAQQRTATLVGSIR